MDRNIHMARVTHISHDGLNITFRSDGSFATGHVDIHAAVAARSGEMTGTRHASGQASGQWSAAGEHFNLCATASSLRTDITVNMRGHLIHITPHTPTSPTTTNYTCSSTTLTTTQPIAGHEPIVTTYSRAH